MKLYINGRFLTQQLTGVQIFAQEICKELEGKIDFELLVPKNQPIINHSFDHKLKRIGFLKGYFWEQITLPNFIKKTPNCMLLNLCNLAPIYTSNQIVTIHDLAFIKNKNWFSFTFQKAYNFIIPQIITNSQFIITVSETIKNELIQTFNISAEKIIVIFNKVSTELMDAKPKPILELESTPFYLMVGSNNPRKNFEFVENIFSNELINESLIVVGSSHVSFNSTNNLKNNSNITRIKNVTAEELAWLYQNTKGLINPSFYEGFGIPNIEAMYFKTPILCSKIPVFEEVCGKYASYFELGNKADFITNLSSLDLSHNSTQNNQYEYFQSKDRVTPLKRILEL